MTKRMLLFACLALLCYGLGAWAVNLQVASQHSRNGMTDARGASMTNKADIMAIKTVRTGALTRHVASPSIPAESTLNPEASEAYNRWLLTGTKTAEEALLIEEYLTRNSSGSGRNPLDLTGGPDNSGYRFVDNQGGDTASFGWIELCGDDEAIDGPVGDDAVTQFTLDWAFPFYGNSYTVLHASTNGMIQFLTGNASFLNFCVGENAPTDPQLFPYWDDLWALDNQGCNGDGTAPWVRFRDFGTHAVVQWKISHIAGTADSYHFEAILYPDGKVKYQYNTSWNDAATPNSATIGIDAAGAGNGLEYRCDLAGPGAQITGGRAIWFYPGPIPPCDITPIGIAEPVESQDESNTTLDANGGCNNDDCGGTNIWTVASCGGDYTGSTFYYVSPICGGGGTFRDSDWWEITLTEPESLVVTVTAENPNTDLIILVTDNNCDPEPTVIASAQQVNECTAFSVTSPRCLEPGTYLIIVLPGFANPLVGNTWDYNMHVECTLCSTCEPPANDMCENAVNVGFLGGTPLSFTGDNTCAIDNCFGGGLYNDVWYEFTTTETCTLTIDFCGSTGTTGSANVYIVLDMECPCPGFHYFADTWNPFDCGDGNWSVIFYDLPPGTYWYPVLGLIGEIFGPYTINFSNCGTACDEIIDLRVHYNGMGVPHNGVNLLWTSPEDLQDTLRIFSSDVSDDDFDSDNGADLDWDYIASVYKGDSVTNSGGFTTRSYHDQRPFVRYRKYNVVRNYCFTPPPPPLPCFADSCELNEITATDGVPMTVDNTCATTHPVWPCGAGGKDVWISYTATATGTVTVSTCSGIGTLTDTFLEAWTDCPSEGGTPIRCLDDFCGLRTTITFTGTGGENYKIRLGGFGSGFGTAEVVITG